MLGLGDNEEKVQLSSIPVVLYPYNGQNDRVCPTRGIFSVISTGHQGIKLSCNRSLLFPSPYAESGNDIGMFSKCIRSTENGGLLSRSQNPRNQQLGDLLACPPQNNPNFWKRRNTYFGSNLWCRLWFFYQTWSSSTTLPTYGCSKVTSKMAKKAALWGPIIKTSTSYINFFI